MAHSGSSGGDPGPSESRAVIRLRPGLAIHGWAGLLPAAFAWPLTWGLPDPSTHFEFFPLWLGYAVVVGTLVLRRSGSGRRSGWRRLGRASNIVQVSRQGQATSKPMSNSPEGLIGDSGGAQFYVSE